MKECFESVRNIPPRHHDQIHDTQNSTANKFSTPNGKIVLSYIRNFYISDWLLGKPVGGATHFPCGD